MQWFLVYAEISFWFVVSRNKVFLLVASRSRYIHVSHSIIRWGTHHMLVKIMYG